jgi:hypothetical protein
MPLRALIQLSRIGRSSRQGDLRDAGMSREKRGGPSQRLNRQREGSAIAVRAVVNSM